MLEPAISCMVEFSGPHQKGDEPIMQEVRLQFKDFNCTLTFAHEPFLMETSNLPQLDRAPIESNRVEPRVRSNRIGPKKVRFDSN